MIIIGRGHYQMDVGQFEFDLCRDGEGSLFIAIEIDHSNNRPGLAAQVIKSIRVVMHP